HIAPITSPTTAPTAPPKTAATAAASTTSTSPSNAAQNVEPPAAPTRLDSTHAIIRRRATLALRCRSWNSSTALRLGAAKAANGEGSVIWSMSVILSGERVAPQAPQLHSKDG